MVGEVCPLWVSANDAAIRVDLTSRLRDAKRRAARAIVHINIRANVG